MNERNFGRLYTLNISKNSNPTTPRLNYFKQRQLYELCDETGECSPSLRKIQEVERISNSKISFMDLRMKQKKVGQLEQGFMKHTFLQSL